MRMFSADAVEKSLLMTQAALHYKGQYLDAAMGQCKRLEDEKQKVEGYFGEQVALLDRERQHSAALETEVRRLQCSLEQVSCTLLTSSPHSQLRGTEYTPPACMRMHAGEGHPAAFREGACQG